MQLMKNLFPKQHGKYMYDHHEKKQMHHQHHNPIIPCMFSFDLFFFSSSNLIYFFISFSSFRMRHNQSFLNRVSFRRRTPTRETPLTSLSNTNTSNIPNAKSMPNATVAAMRSCIDTLSETASITPSLGMLTPHEGSSSGKLAGFNFLLLL
jgi:hypothetical protein